MNLVVEQVVLMLPINSHSNLLNHHSLAVYMWRGQEGLSHDS